MLYHKKISISIHTIAEHGTSEGSLENVKLADTVKKIKEKLIKDHVCLSTKILLDMVEIQRYW